jgi:predicted DNA-binding transcriptional regulator AlpA
VLLFCLGRPQKGAGRVKFSRGQPSTKAPPRPSTKAPPNEVMPRRGLSIDEYCRAYNISRGTFYNMLKRGNGPKIMKMGARTVISIEAIEEDRRLRESA